MEKIEVEILSPQGEIFKGEAENIVFLTPKGEIQILPGHCEAFFLIEREIKLPFRKFFIKKGVCYFNENKAKIFISFA